MFCQIWIAFSQIVSDRFLDENVRQGLEVVNVVHVLLVTSLLLKNYKNGFGPSSWVHVQPVQLWYQVVKIAQVNWIIT